MIIVDAYRQPYIPFYLTTREFFQLTHERLGPGGAVIINVGHPEDSTKLERMLSAGLRDSYAHVARDPITHVNTLLIASDRRPSAAAVRGAMGKVDPRLRPVLEGTARRLAPALRRRPGVHGRQGARGVADRPVDRGLRRGGPLIAPGTMGVSGRLAAMARIGGALRHR